MISQRSTHLARQPPLASPQTAKPALFLAAINMTSQGRLIFRLHDKRITSIEVIDFLGQMLKQH
jgi:hypothetical protein